MASLTAAQAGGSALLTFLDLIAWSEGTSISPVTKDGGYDVIVTGVDGPSIFTSYVDHPFADGRAPVVVQTDPLLESTAAGRYQILLRWWQPYKAQLRLLDFGPASQDLYALEQIKERHATGLILDGDIEAAIAACSNIWASLPGNDYGQPGSRTMAELLAKYQALS